MMYEQRIGKTVTVYVFNSVTKIYSHKLKTQLDVLIDNMDTSYDYTLTPPPDYNHIWRWVGAKWVELLPINNPDIPYGDEYEWNEEQSQWVISPELDLSLIHI